MIICSNHSNFNGSNRGGVVNDIRIAVFNNGVGVPEHNGGLNIYSLTDNNVFSSYNTPFIINRFSILRWGNRIICFLWHV